MNTPTNPNGGNRSGMSMPSFAAVRPWTKSSARKLQALTRKIIKIDGGDHNIRRMAYEIEKRQQAAETK